MKPTLLVMAAGMGSRYGGLKQIEPVGPNGETIVDYSIFDAIRAGFGKIVFVIRESFAEPFREIFEPKLKDKIEVRYAFQELDNLPAGFSLPTDRVKPWGTGHAIMITRDIIKEPFCALNADDFYGFEAFKTMSDFLSHSNNPDVYAMVGYKLSNTLSEYGSVTRGICKVDKNDTLQEIVEVLKIIKKGNHVFSIEADGSEIPLTGDESASMNMWGFQPSLFERLEKYFSVFLKNHIHELKSEFFIPSVVSDIITDKEATVKVLKADSTWFGITYKEDTPRVIKMINELIEKGHYPKKLY